LNPYLFAVRPNLECVVHCAIWLVKYNFDKSCTVTVLTTYTLLVKTQSTTKSTIIVFDAFDKWYFFALSRIRILNNFKGKTAN